MAHWIQMALNHLIIWAKNLIKKDLIQDKNQIRNIEVKQHHIQVQ